MTSRASDALIVGKEAMVADRQSVPVPSGPGPADRLNHGLPGPHVKAHSRANAPVGEKQRLREAWAKFLGSIWFQWFATLTFENNVHPEAALKRYQRFTNDLNRELYGRRWMKQPLGGIYWVVAVERQKRGVVHLHALMGDPDNLNVVVRRLTWMDKWNEIAGFARIEAIRSNDAALRYVTKYVVKDGDIEFSKNLGKFVGPEQLELRTRAK